MVFRVLVEVCLKILSSSREIGILGRETARGTPKTSLLVRAFYWYSETALLLN